MACIAQPGTFRVYTLVLVVLPQGLRAVLPDLASNIVTAAQPTALASVVTLPELLQAAMVANSSTYNATSLIAAGVAYLALLWSGIVLVNRLEKRRRPVGNIPLRDPGCFVGRRQRT